MDWSRPDLVLCLGFMLLYSYFLNYSITCVMYEAQWVSIVESY